MDTKASTSSRFPIAKDCLTIIITVMDKEELVHKKLLQVSVRELYNDCIKPEDEGGLKEARDASGKVIIGLTALRYLMPPQVKKITNSHKVMCGCEVCISAASLHESLKAWRLQHLKWLHVMMEGTSNLCSSSSTKEWYNTYKDVEYPNNKHVHTDASDVAMSTMCTFPIDGIDIPQWKCVLKCCFACPSILVPNEELKRDEVDTHSIPFHVYKNIHHCSIHKQRCITDEKLCSLCNDEPNETKRGKVHKSSLQKWWNFFWLCA